MSRHDGGEETVATRVSQGNKFQSKLTYHFSSTANDNNQSVVIREDTNCVDGIGGTTWEGALVSCKLLEMLLADTLHVTQHPVHLLSLPAARACAAWWRPCLVQA